METGVALFFGVFLGCLVGRQYGFMEARRLSDTLRHVRAGEGRREPPEDTELAYFGDRWVGRN